jgi:SAM-dependent methyltransferase
MKNISHKFFNQLRNVKSYTSMYKKKIDINKIYPANTKRLDIFIKLLKKYNPKKIVDAGCGTGMPLIRIKKLGFNIIGYDKAKNMITKAKKNLEQNNLNTNLIFEDNFEKPSNIKNNSIDCILGMGTFYYSKNFNKTLKHQTSKLKKNGRIIFSLRNELFNIASFNNYSINFFSKFYKIENQNPKIKNFFYRLFKGFDKRKNIKFKNIDDEKVYSSSHNPLTIISKLQKLNIRTNGIYYYHFHYLPSLFEKMDKKEFRKKSLKLERPNDWKGILMASAFVVDGQKIK